MNNNKEKRQLSQIIFNIHLILSKNEMIKNIKIAIKALETDSNG
jgi:hypothetical protein